MSFEPLKNSLNIDFFQPFFNTWSYLNPDFDKLKMEESIFDRNWDNLELKARSRHLALMIHEQLPTNFNSASKFLILIIENLKSKNQIIFSYEYFFIADYIEVFGQKDYTSSIAAMEQITKYITCEFAVRPFIINDQDKLMQQMLDWSTHPHENVRRFASEGSRPKLPWGMALKKLIKDPTPILPILENLKADNSLFVRKSVANNLNDISKDHPELVLDLLKRWQNYSEHTNWIIKHACRTLLKAGNPKAMQLFGYADNAILDIGAIQLQTPIVKMGSQLRFSFTIKNKSSKKELIRLEYGLYFLKANGKQNRKVFKLTEREFKSDEETSISKKHTIKEITTRKYYLGNQKLSLIVNGIELEQTNFILD
jgi:3-methyladenine DNA glycosylase AlkC